MIHLHQPGTWIFGSWSSWAWQAIHKWFHNRNQQQLDQLHNQPRFDSLCHSLRHPLCNSRNSAFGWDPRSFASWKKHVFVSKQWSSILLNTSKPHIFVFILLILCHLLVSHHISNKSDKLTGATCPRYPGITGWKVGQPGQPVQRPMQPVPSAPSAPSGPSGPSAPSAAPSVGHSAAAPPAAGAPGGKIWDFFCQTNLKKSKSEVYWKIPTPKDGIYQLMYKHVFGWLGCIIISNPWRGWSLQRLGAFALKARGQLRWKVKWSKWFLRDDFLSWWWCKTSVTSFWWVFRWCFLKKGLRLAGCVLCSLAFPHWILPRALTAPSCLQSFACSMREVWKHCACDLN